MHAAGDQAKQAVPAVQTLRKLKIKKHTACFVPVHFAGDLAKQAVQRFESFKDLDTHQVTIEEREEYEQHLKAGTVVGARAGGLWRRWPRCY